MLLSNLLFCMFRSGYSVLLCRSVYWSCIKVYCTTSTGCHPNLKLTNISYHNTLISNCCSQVTHSWSTKFRKPALLPSSVTTDQELHPPCWPSENNCFLGVHQCEYTFRCLSPEERSEPLCLRWTSYDGKHQNKQCFGLQVSNYQQ